MSSLFGIKIENPSYVPETAWLGHGPFAMWLVNVIQPRRIVELGTHNGFSYFSFCEAVQRYRINTKCFAVDTWRGDEHAYFYGEDVYHRVKQQNEKYEGFSVLLRKTFAEALSDIEDGSVDLLHVDGRHFYDDVKNDFESWAPKLSSRAVVLFHDTMVTERGFGVHKYWKEISRGKPSISFRHQHGLGVLFWGSESLDSTGDLKELISDPIGHKVFCDLFENSAELFKVHLDFLKLSSDLMAKNQKAQILDQQCQSLLAHNNFLKDKLIEARKRPMRMLWKKILFKILKKLSKLEFILGRRAADRFAKSAQKRDPRRDEFGSMALGISKITYADVVSQWSHQRKSQSQIINHLALKLSDGPLISIVVPVYNPDLKHLSDMIDSVIAQTYNNWQLCIADDCSSQAVQDLLALYAKQHEKISVIFRDKNGHISEATNTAISIATGDYVSFLDHDDLLDPDALLETVVAIKQNKKIKLIYTDEDIINDDGSPLYPYFKPDFNLDLLYSHNYITHFFTIESSLLKALGGLRPGYEGAQDYDLVLRASEHLEPDQILHIPKVLYHWRASNNCTAKISNAKPYAMQAGQRALSDHLRRKYGRPIEVTSGTAAFTYKVIWPLGSKPLVSIIIPTKDRLDLIRTAVESVLNKTDYENFEVIIVDNASVDVETHHWLEHIQKCDTRVRVIHDNRPFNYSALNNAAVAMSSGEFVLLLNNDIEVISHNWLSEMVSLALRPDVGCVGAKLYFQDGRIQHSGVVIGLGGVAAHVHSHFDRTSPGYMGRLQMRQNFTAVTAACLLVRRSIFEAVGGLNETELAIAFNDVDFCLKVHTAGYRNIWTPYAELFHYESASRGHEDTPQKRARFAAEAEYMKRSWKTETYRDPAYNPNMTLDNTDFSFAMPFWGIPNLDH